MSHHKTLGTFCCYFSNLLSQTYSSSLSRIFFRTLWTELFRSSHPLYKGALNFISVCLFKGFERGWINTDFVKLILLLFRYFMPIDKCANWRTKFDTKEICLNYCKFFTNSVKNLFQTFRLSPGHFTVFDHINNNNYYYFYYHHNFNDFDFFVVHDRRHDYRNGFRLWWRPSWWRQWLCRRCWTCNVDSDFWTDSVS